MRALAEHGEKMVQKDRSVDYKEDFEETASEFELSLEADDSDEEWQQLKEQAAMLKAQKTRKQVVPAQTKHLQTDPFAGGRADRTVLVGEGIAGEEISAFDGPQHDEIKARRER